MPVNVLTQHNDNARAGTVLIEDVPNTSNVNVASNDIADRNGMPGAMLALSASVSVAVPVD